MHTPAACLILAPPNDAGQQRNREGISVLGPIIIFLTLVSLPSLPLHMDGHWRDSFRRKGEPASEDSTPPSAAVTPPSSLPAGLHCSSPPPVQCLASSGCLFLCDDSNDPLLCMPLSSSPLAPVTFL